MSWAPDDLLKLVLTVTRSYKPVGVDWADVAQKLGTGRSGGACQQKFGELIKKGPPASMGKTGASASAPKPKAKAPAPAAMKGRVTRSTAASSADEGDDHDEEVSPNTTMKGAKKATKGAKAPAAAAGKKRKAAATLEEEENNADQDTTAEPAVTLKTEKGIKKEVNDSKPATLTTRGKHGAATVVIKEETEAENDDDEEKTGLAKPLKGSKKVTTTTTKAPPTKPLTGTKRKSSTAEDNTAAPSASASGTTTTKPTRGRKRAPSPLSPTDIPFRFPSPSDGLSHPEFYVPYTDARGRYKSDKAMEDELDANYERAVAVPESPPRDPEELWGGEYDGDYGTDMVPDPKNPVFVDEVDWTGDPVFGDMVGNVEVVESGEEEVDIVGGGWRFEEVG